MPRSRYRVKDAGSPYFIGSTIVDWLPLLCRSRFAEIFFGSMIHMADSARINIHAYVIMRNHIHMIVSSDNLVKEMGLMKSYTARCIIDTLVTENDNDTLEQLRNAKCEHKTDRPHQLWQEGFHPKLIRDNAMLRQKTDYIHYNPVRKGYCEQPEDWYYSSVGASVERIVLTPLSV